MGCKNFNLFKIMVRRTSCKIYRFNVYNSTALFLTPKGILVSIKPFLKWFLFNVELEMVHRVLSDCALLIPVAIQLEARWRLGCQNSCFTDSRVC